MGRGGGCSCSLSSISLCFLRGLLPLGSLGGEERGERREREEGGGRRRRKREGERGREGGRESAKHNTFHVHELSTQWLHTLLMW